MQVPNFAEMSSIIVEGIKEALLFNFSTGTREGQKNESHYSCAYSCKTRRV